MAMKVSDEFTVPLGVGHHDALHRTGDERAWRAAQDIDPLSVALRLWIAPDKAIEFPANVATSPSPKAAMTPRRRRTPKRRSRPRGEVTDEGYVARW